MTDSVFETLIANYEQRLNQDSRWALSDGSRHFDAKGDGHALCKLLPVTGDR